MPGPDQARTTRGDPLHGGRVDVDAAAGDDGVDVVKRAEGYRLIGADRPGAVSTTVRRAAETTVRLKCASAPSDVVSPLWIDSPPLP